MSEGLFITLKYIAIICFIVAITVPFWVQNKMYYPSNQHFQVSVDYEDVFFLTDDDVKINGWYVKPKTKNITVVFCHGNGGNLSFYEEIIRNLQNNGYGVLAIDYRGYGKSEGKPNEQGLYTDLRAAVNYLEQKKNTPKKDIVLWGLSLGGAVVTQIASETDSFRGVVLQSTFTNVKEMTSYILHRGYLGVKSNHTTLFTHSLFKMIPTIQKYDTKSKIHKIKSPLLIAHTISDNIVPVYMGKELSTLSTKNTTELFISDKGGHNEHIWLYPKLFNFLSTLENKVAQKN